MAGVHQVFLCLQPQQSTSNPTETIISHHARRHPLGLHEASVSCWDSISWFQCFGHLYHTAATGRRAHAGAHHPHRRHVLYRLPPAPVGFYLCFLSTLLHWLLTQRSAHGPGARGRHLQVLVLWKPFSGEHGLTGVWRLSVLLLLMMMI